MKYGISKISIIPVRADKTEQSEMVTQILFGEMFQIIEEDKNWVFVKLIEDGYQGWLSADSFTGISDDEFMALNKSESKIVRKLFETVKNVTKQEILILPFGSVLPRFNVTDSSFAITDTRYELQQDDDIKDYDISYLAKQFLNAPYLWGGKNPMGIDCSGFTQLIYKAMQIQIPRDASQQVNLGQTINFVNDARLGDLAFFDNDEGSITHVGVVLNNNEIIHSSIKVRIDKLDQQGIFNKEFNRYTHKLRVIKRII